VVPFNFTAVAPVKFVPVMVTDVPTGPLVGTKLVMVGDETVAVTVKFAAELPLPLAVVTETFPVVAPLGTVAVICVALFTAYVAAIPLKETAVAPVRFVPATTTEVPTGPLVGWNEETVGNAGGGGVVELLPPPHEAKAIVNMSNPLREMPERNVYLIDLDRPPLRCPPNPVLGCVPLFYCPMQYAITFSVSPREH